MGKRISAVLAVGALVFASVAAEAVPLTGAFSKTGTFIPVIGATGATATLGSATGLDFTTIGFPNVATPGIAGTFTVTDSEGSFALLTPVGSTGLIDDFTFSGPGTGAGTGNFPSPPVANFETTGTGLSFTLTSIAVLFQDSGSFNLLGTGTFTAPGFDPTAGTVRIQGSQAGSTFAFSASQSAVVPEPTTLILLGAALGGIAGVNAIRRRTKRG